MYRYSPPSLLRSRIRLYKEGITIAEKLVKIEKGVGVIQVVSLNAELELQVRLSKKELVTVKVCINLFASWMAILTFCFRAGI